MRKSILHFILVLVTASAAWSVSVSAHELVGHGGVCALDPACNWHHADGMNFGGMIESGSWDELRLAAGSLVSIGLALGAAILLRMQAGSILAIRIFLWSLMAIGLIQSGSYIAFGPMIHEGMDWSRLQRMYEWSSLSLMIGGLAVIAVGVFLAGRSLHLLASSLGGRAATVLTAMLGFGSTAMAVAMIVPSDNLTMMIWAGIGLGTFFMSWLIVAILPIWGGNSGGPVTASLEITRLDYLALIPFVLVIGAYIMILSPGISFQP